MELRLIGGSTPAVKMDESAKEEFKKHRKQQLQLKKKRKFELKQIEEKAKEEEEMLFKDPMKSQSKSPDEVAHLKDMVKKLQQKYS